MLDAPSTHVKGLLTNNGTSCGVGVGEILGISVGLIVGLTKTAAAVNVLFCETALSVKTANVARVTKNPKNATTEKKNKAYLIRFVRFVKTFVFLIFSLSVFPILFLYSKSQTQ